MLVFSVTGDPSLSLEGMRQRSARQDIAGPLAGPKGAPPTIPPIIITPFSYQTPAPAIDPYRRPPSPPLTPPYRPSLSLACT